MKALKTIVFFPYLLALFFCVHGSLENYGFVEPREVLWIGLVITSCIAIAHLLLFLFTWDNISAALIVFFISTWYLFFGAIHDWVKSHVFLFFLTRYSVFLPLLLLLTVAWIFFIKRKKQLRPKLVFYFNILLLIYCGIDAAQLGYKYATAKKPTPAMVVGFDASKVKVRPNVYYLLFDEYPGYESLKARFAYSNDSLYDFFRQHEFEMLPTFSNYDYTVFSMSSIFNMQYVPVNYDPDNLDQRDFQRRTKEIRNGTVFSLFKKMGYRIQNYSIFDIDDQRSVSDQNSFLPVHSQLLTDKIWHNRIIRTTGWFLQKGKFALPFLKKRYMYEHDIDNKYSIKKVLESATEADKSPKFCYAHFLMPHGPFYQDSLGRATPEPVADDDYTWTKEYFLSYLKYTNTVIRDLSSRILLNDPASIIIVMSDHGYHAPGEAKTNNLLNYDNICAVHFPAMRYFPLKDKWSTVNFFPYLFNREFGQHMPYQPDSTVRLYHLPHE